MDAIQAITNHDGQDQHHHCEAQIAHKTSLSNATRKAGQSASKPQGSLANKRNKRVVMAL
jgi:hypothetical protein